MLSGQAAAACTCRQHVGMKYTHLVICTSLAFGYPRLWASCEDPNVPVSTTAHNAVQLFQRCLLRTALTTPMPPEHATAEPG